MKFVSLLCCAAVFLLFFAPEVQGLDQAKTKNLQKCSENIEPENKTPKNSTMPFDAITIFLCGDVMTVRGIDQILAHPGDPVIYESYLKDARGYVKIAEAVNGPIDYPVGFAYVWGDALEELDRAAPDVRIVNLETSVTKSSDYWKGKGINYRMHPENIPILAVAKIDVCSLANNHTLDWGYAGLSETLASLKKCQHKNCRGRERSF